MPFAPVVAIDLSTHAPKGVPAIVAHVTQASGESPISGMSLVFPKAFGYNDTFTVPRCSSAQEEAEACPEDSRIGTVAATSPLGNASGSVFITDDFRVVAFAQAYGGLIKIKVIGNVSIDPAGGFAVDFTGLPDLPLSSVDLGLEAGPKGLLKNPARCGTYTLPSTFVAHDGSQAKVAPEVAITGCAPPSVSDVVVGAGARRLQVLWDPSETTDATRVSLQRRKRSGWADVAQRKVRGDYVAFARQPAGRYRVRLTALPGGKTATQAFSVAG